MSKTFNAFSNMVFEEYQFREYPMHVYPDAEDGSYEKSKSKAFVEVNSDKEHAEALSTGKVVRAVDEKARLLLIADIKAVKHDKRWGEDKLRAAIEDAGHDPDFDPYT